MPSILTNWKTTLLGLGMIVAGVASLLHVQIQGVSVTADPTTLIMGGIGLIFAKDHNVTGGIIANTPVSK